MNLELELSAGMREAVGTVRRPGEILASASRRYRRRRALRRTAVAAAVLGTAGAITASVLPGNVRPPVPIPAAPGPEVLTADLVASRVREALDENTIVHLTATQRPPNRRAEIWFDNVGKKMLMRHYDSSGAVTDESSFDSGTTTMIDHQRRTWWTRTQTESKVPAPVPVTPEVIRAALADGATLTIVGNEPIDGRATVHLRRSGSLDSPLGPATELWVAADTYEVVRLVFDKGGLQFQNDFEWLDRTPEALARLTVTPPPAFTRVDPSAAGSDGSGVG